MTLIEFLKEQEGFSPTWYRDGPCWSIGYGHHSCDPNPRQQITQVIALKLLKRDIQAARERAGRDFWVITGQRIAKLPKRHQEALVEMTFNLGGLRGFPKFTRALARGDVDTAIRECRRYAVVEGKRIELRRRNQAFIQTFLLEQPDMGPVALTWPMWVAGIKHALIKRIGL